jgi:hypothetical protein
MRPVTKQSLMQRFNNKWAHKAYKPIKRITQILEFYWEQSLMQRSQNQQMGPQAPKPIKRITQILGFYWEQSLMQRSRNQQMGPQGP